MTTRREFLQASIATSAARLGPTAVTSAAPASSTGPAASTTPAAPPFYKAVFDERFPDSIAFGAEMTRLGVPVHGIKGDMTDLWYHDLHPRWQKALVPIAGLTAHGPLFCLERLAWDYGMRVVFRAEHQYRSDACVEHVLSAPDAVLRLTSDLSDAGLEWSAHLARLLGRCLQGGPQQSQEVVTRLAQAGTVDQEPLFSWVIAPVVRL